MNNDDNDEYMKVIASTELFDGEKDDIQDESAYEIIE